MAPTVTPQRPALRVLFRVAAGRRLGFGHLARARSLAQALGVPATLSVRGTAETRAIAARLGARVLDGTFAAALRTAQPALIVIDDPDPRAATQALAAARRHVAASASASRATSVGAMAVGATSVGATSVGATSVGAASPSAAASQSPSNRHASARGGTREQQAVRARIASLHDLGIAGIASDLAIDGSVTPAVELPAHAALTGPRYAILDPGLLALRSTPRGGGARVLISLGGGPRRALGLRLARALRRALPAADVTLAGGFTQPASGTRASRTAASETRSSDARPEVQRILQEGVRTLPSPAAFRPALAAADVAVLAGGVTLYEAAALGVPTVALAVVPAQRPTIRAFAAERATLDAGAVGARADEAETIQAVVHHVTRLLGDGALRGSIARRGRGLVDGRGATRAASALRKLVTSS